MIRDKAGNRFTSQEDMRDFYKEYDNTIKEFMMLREDVMSESKDGEDISDIVDLGSAYAFQVANQGHASKPMDFLRLMNYMINKYKRYSHSDTRQQNSDIRKQLFAKNSRKITTSRAKMPVMDIWDVDTQSVERDEQRDRKKKSAKPKPKRKPIKKVVRKCRCKK
jgi:hypothetical protein